MPTDRLHRFHFQHAPARGHWVRLEQVWVDACAHRNYSPPVRDALGEMLAITAMVANDLKDRGAVALQSVGDGPLAMSFAECRAQTKLRAIAHTQSNQPDSTHSATTYKELVGHGKVAISLIPEQGETYQGLVVLDAPDLATNVEQYFANSEQLTTRILLGSTGETITGCLLQRLPSTGASDIALDQDNEAWTRVLALFETIAAKELAENEVEPLLRRVFPRDAIYLDHAKALRFECTCSRERTAVALGVMPVEELDEILEEDGMIEVTCEFCGKIYQYDALALFEATSGNRPKLH